MSIANGKKNVHMKFFNNWKTTHKEIRNHHIMNFWQASLAKKIVLAIEMEDQHLALKIWSWLHISSNQYTKIAYQDTKKL
jgi:hypothetical protein